MKNGHILRVALLMVAQVLCVTLLLALLIGIGISMPSPAGGWVYDGVMWAVAPLLGFASACLVTRIGVPYGLAWFAPPLCQVAAHTLLVGMLPSSPGMPMVVLLLSVFGAAFGHEWKARARGRARIGNKKK